MILISHLTKKYHEVALERPGLATCKKENLIEIYFQQSNPFINSLLGFDGFLVTFPAFAVACV